jgi:hypothetical protein
MEVNQVKEVLTLLLIKKNNFSVSEEEHQLINELEYLLKLAQKNQSNALAVECKCAINESTITAEIAANQCFNCRLPLSIA